MGKPAKQKAATHQRMLVSLPRPVVERISKYARICRGGNKSGFVADAVEAYIKALRRHRHTQKLRHSYAAAAAHSLAIAAEWRQLDDEAWTKLDQLELSAQR
jgi:metal-responsive CopG/Arc/MetJ family transcriptional regulator